MTAPTAEQHRAFNRHLAFSRAWDDLYERLTDGVNALSEIQDSKTDEAEQARILDKNHGLQEGLIVYLDVQVSNHGGFEGAWRAYTDQMTDILNGNGRGKDRTPGFYQGVHLALTYQTPLQKSPGLSGL